MQRKRVSQTHAGGQPVSPLEPLKPEVMRRQLAGLAGDLRQLTRPFAQQIQTVLSSAEWTAVKNVYLTGDGDSYHASCALEMAFETLADVGCRPMSAQRFVDYGAQWMRQALVLATSASGGTPRVVQAIERAKQHGALSVAVTGTPNSPVARAADRSIVVELPHKERSPGIRTYQASLMGLLLVAIQLGEMQGKQSQTEADALRQELVALADVVDATTAAVKEPCQEVAETVAAAPTLVTLVRCPA